MTDTALEWVTDELKVHFDREAETGEHDHTTNLTALMNLHAVLTWEWQGLVRREDWSPETLVYAFIEDPRLLAQVQAALH